jgi:pyridoxine 5'-phosphate synthase PdxJ
MPIIVPDPPRTTPQIDLSVELKVQRRNTAMYIAYDPIQVTLIPRTQTRTPSGGTKFEDGEPRLAQVMRLIPTTSDQKPTVTLDGKERQIDFVLMGQWDAEMQPYDYWRDEEGQRYEVVEIISAGKLYERKGLVVLHGHGR